MCPTDADVIERLNSLTDVINSGEERHFDGSKKLIWLGVIVGILMYWICLLYTSTEVYCLHRDGHCR